MRKHMRNQRRQNRQLSNSTFAQVQTENAREDVHLHIKTIKMPKRTIIFNVMRYFSFFLFSLTSFALNRWHFSTVASYSNDSDPNKCKRRKAHKNMKEKKWVKIKMCKNAKGNNGNEMSLSADEVEHSSGAHSFRFVHHFHVLLIIFHNLNLWPGKEFLIIESMVFFFLGVKIVVKIIIIMFDLYAMLFSSAFPFLFDIAV